MTELLTAMVRLLDSSPMIALLAAFVWGVLSILLSPCHLASIPLVVGFLSSPGRVGAPRAWAISGTFAFGILISIAAVGGLTIAMGRMAGDVGAYGNFGVAILLAGAGLHFMGILPFEWATPTARTGRGSGLRGALILGLLFGAALGPCTFAFMAPLLGIVFRIATSAPLNAAGMLSLFAVGHCAVIVLAGSSATLVQRYLDWNDEAVRTKQLRAVSGGLLLLAALYFVFTAP